MGIECPIDRMDLYMIKLFIYADGQSDLQSFLTFIAQDMEALDRGGNAYEVVQKGYSRQRRVSLGGQAWDDKRTGICVWRQQ